MGIPDTEDRTIKGGGIYAPGWHYKAGYNSIRSTLHHKARHGFPAVAGAPLKGHAMSEPINPIGCLDAWTPDDPMHDYSYLRTIGNAAGIVEDDDVS